MIRFRAAPSHTISSECKGDLYKGRGHVRATAMLDMNSWAWSRRLLAVRSSSAKSRSESSGFRAPRVRSAPQQRTLEVFCSITAPRVVPTALIAP